ncbi:MAG: hypothetical protein E7F58_17250 [Clostridium saudiense]|uniref:hypothetical protein n=1 Tax=Clostridium saudiense TaxID=1414720 RepID=UPI002907AA8B|nr:hypothetical protein [Clostridium saudiense]MDU3523360.1 hypothetical protein [Clostridium saudiense]
MNKINWEDFLQRIKTGERLGSIAKAYGVHKYYLIASIILKIKENGIKKDKDKTIVEIEEYILKVFEYSRTMEKSICELSAEIDQLAIKHQQTEEEIMTLLAEYKDFKKSGSDLIYEYDEYKEDFEKIIEMENERLKDSIEKALIIVDEIGANNYEQVKKCLKQNIEFKQILKKVCFIKEVSTLMLEEKKLEEAIRIVNEKRKEYYPYSQFTKDMNLMGFKVNTKSNVLYHLEDENLRVLAQIKECAMLLSESEDIKFKRGYKENNDLYKELEIIALEKGLTVEEFKELILLRFLDRNYTKVRKFR